MKKQSAFDAALSVWNPNSYVHLDHLSNLEDEMISKIEMELFLSSNTPTPESLYSEKEIETKKRELFNALSAEAKEIVRIIVDCPKELSCICLAGNLDNVSVTRLACLLRKQWRERKIVHQILEEVFSFAIKIEGLSDGN